MVSASLGRYSGSGQNSLEWTC